jgi:hypothetical protein
MRTLGKLFMAAAVDMAILKIVHRGVDRARRAIGV